MSIRKSERHGLSLIEVMIVIACVTLLLQMLLPAVQTGREAARRTSCANNLRQISYGIMMHTETHSRYPSGGWGSFWVGDPDRGYGKEQPGSWVYNILEYIERTDLRQRGRASTGTSRMEAISEVCRTPVPVFYCSSRRLPKAYPRSNSNGWITLDGSQALPINSAARSDYAINAGDGQAQVLGDLQPPRSYVEAESKDFKWYDTSELTGISFGRSEVRAHQIVDGLSKTYMVGEKFIAANSYTNGGFKADNECMYSGFDNDNCRSTKNLPWNDRSLSEDGADIGQHINSFGSAHPTVWQASFCDGSVHVFSYEIDPAVHARLGNRQDGAIISISD